MVSVLFMGNGVVDSDLTFNTYMDVTLYVLAAIVIVKKLNPLWIIVLSVLGSLNRETALFIPALYFLSAFRWDAWPSLKEMIISSKQVIAITTVSVVLFFAIFIAIRLHYGLEPVSTWRVSAGWPMLKLNLFSSVSIKTYMELYGIMGFMLFWAVLVYPTMNKQLRLFLFTLVPIWLGIHFISAIGYQSRLYLVPTLLVLVPAVLENLEYHYRKLSTVKAD
jgi:hypothetical protein